MSLRSLQFTVIAITAAFALTGCGRSASDATEPLPTPTGISIEGQSSATSATIRFDSADGTKTVDYRVSVYAPRKLDSDDDVVTMPHETLDPSRERDIQPKFLCRDFSAAHDAVVPVVWERKTGPNGSELLQAPALETMFSAIDGYDLDDYGISDVQLVGLTGNCQSFKTNTMTFLPDLPATQSGSEIIESRLIVFKGYYGPANPDGRPEVLDGLHMNVGAPSADSQISGSPSSALRSLEEHGCKNIVVVPLTASPAPNKYVAPFTCPEIDTARSGG